MGHYILIALFVVGIIVVQIIFFIKNLRKQKELKTIFPTNCDEVISISTDNGVNIIAEINYRTNLDDLDGLISEIDEKVESLNSNIQDLVDELKEIPISIANAQIRKDLNNDIAKFTSEVISLNERKNDLSLASQTKNISVKNSIFNNIIVTINSYLVENRAAISDFHLIKDIVDRNSDSTEEEISTLTPIPLYLGLMGTMLGILVGVGFLVFSGGVEALLSTEDTSAGNGIIELLGGVAIAMASSLSGILLTTWSSYNMKSVKSTLNSNKNAFLSWLQVKLLPSLTGNATTAIVTLQQNLTVFNETFATNVAKMESAFSFNNQSVKDQLKIMQLVDKMDINLIAKSNISVLTELQKSTKEFERFSVYMNNVNDYLNMVNKLSVEVNEHLNRTKVIEDMGQFFKEEIIQIETRKGILSRSVGNVDDTLSSAIEKLTENTEIYIEEFKKSSVKKHEDIRELVNRQQEDINALINKQKNYFEEIISEQNILVSEKLKEVPNIINELKDVSLYKDRILGLESSTASLNERMIQLVSAINSLVTNQVNQSSNTADEYSPSVRMTKYSIPKWIKVSLITGTVLLSIASLIFIVSFILLLIDKLF